MWARPDRRARWKHCAHPMAALSQIDDCKQRHFVPTSVLAEPRGAYRPRSGRSRSLVQARTAGGGLFRLLRRALGPQPAGL